MFEEILGYIATHQEQYLNAARIHVIICVTTLGISMLLGIPLGILSAKRPIFSVTVVNVFNALKMIPSLAVLLVVIPVLGTGFGPALFALCLHAIPVMIINTYTGFKNLDAAVLESAAGMGLSTWEILFKVELPLALPLIFTGIRTSMVDIIASATLAAYIGAGGFGEFIVSGLSFMNFSVMMVGGLSIAALAILVDLLLSLIQRQMTRYT